MHFREFRRPFFQHEFQIIPNRFRIKIDRFLNFFNLFWFFDGNAQRIHKPVAEIKLPTNDREFDELGIIENTSNVLVHVVVVFSRIFRDMLRPENGRLLAFVEERRIRILIRPDDLNLFF